MMHILAYTASTETIFHCSEDTNQDAIQEAFQTKGMYIEDSWASWISLLPGIFIFSPTTKLEWTQYFCTLLLLCGSISIIFLRLGSSLIFPDVNRWAMPAKKKQ